RRAPPRDGGCGGAWGGAGERPRQRPSRRKTAREDAHDRRVRLVGRAFSGRNHAGTLGLVAEFKTSQAYRPTGDQPDAIAELSAGIEAGGRYQPLLGATGTGKTAAMAVIVEQMPRPSRLIAHHTTLAPQP